MRDMLARKFERCCRAAGFSPVPQDGVFVSTDGLRVSPALKGVRFSGAESIDRRATLQLLLAARKARITQAGTLSITEHTRAPDAGEPPATRDALHPHAASSAPKNDATGARTPVASETKPQAGE
ncbi:hypothetical protein DYQ93_11570 [Xanthomonas sp. LMG 8992]|uniref:hypothetical protein n=1 Tax=Xanthomonas sp. LMG 8992 TaxID=1591157 RepID=UPI0013682324|nr:hypothetical protein [Xanthomonas sp. LMG 8992]MXV11659.1 hypothetical protein [Xanthomonas sp. LMG 8992]